MIGEGMTVPFWLDVFAQPLMDNKVAQVAFVALCILICLDMLFGFCAAAKDGRVQSSKMRQGIWHKVSEFGVVALADVVDGMMLGGIDMGYSAPVMTSSLVLLCANEVVSVAENLVKLNPDLAAAKVLDRLMESSAVRGAGDGREGE